MKRLLKNRTDQSGFTLVELLVVIGILAILLAVTIIAINPVLQFQNARNAQRQSDVTSILDAIYEYMASNAGTVPPSMANVTTSAKSLASPASVSLINLCPDLAPTYIADMPKDPLSSVSSVTGGATPCNASTTAYVTGYTILKNAAGNRYTIASTGAENGATISVTR